MSNKMYEYFDRKPSEWSFQGFLDECDLEPPQKRLTVISSALRRLRIVRCETAQVLLNPIKNFVCYFCKNSVKMSLSRSHLRKA
jgi:hypothetical protein